MKIPVTQISVMNFFLMLGVTFVLSVETDLFNKPGVEMYEFYSKVFPQEVYALAAFVAACILFTAFIFKSRNLEMIGLFFSGTYLLFILSGYMLTFPNLGSVAFAIWTLASFMSIVEVLNSIQDEKEEKRARRKTETLK